MSWPNFKFDKLQLRSELEANYGLITKKLQSNEEQNTELRHSLVF